MMVALRCGLVMGAAATLFAGCGIVADSDPAREWEESRLKLRTMIAALGGAAEPDR
jgi:menaquinone-specific isochorismate synthase